MSDSRKEITDPNLEGLPPEAFEEIEGSPSLPQLEARIRIKREQAMQDEGVMQSPHHADDIEPLPPPETTPPEAEEQPEEQEVVSEEEPEEGDEQTDEELPDADPLEPADDEEFYVGRYRTKEEAESGIREQHHTIERLFRERYQREQQAQQQQQQQAQQQGEQGEQPKLDADTWHEWASQAVEEEQGVQGAMAALEKGGPQGYDIYVAHWLESEDPEQRATAIAFNNEVQRQFAAMHARAAVQPQPPQQVSNGEIPDDPQVAQRVVAARFADFDELIPEMDRLMAAEDGLGDDTKRWLVDLAEEGGTGKARAWEYLYHTAKATRLPVREQTVKKERQRRKVSADADKLAATVSSSEGASTRTPLSEAEQAVIRRKNGIREKAGLPLLPEE